ncbi:MAG: DegT/DnrJ/EryC1/StrS family aminotransferase [Synergistaceae bacterium]|jgi:8-amino-3,8-dideoxy-alpha-D-manno-octulosonate transaminase|nr:DegT/DnrJ/EryC1/StrS family aminotransferase [Synergistaceae bacterium]
MPGYELFDDEEKRHVNEVMETGVITPYGFTAARKGRWKVRELEEAIRLRTGSKYALMLSDGTAALTVALAAMGIGAGDEVIIPTFTFVATFESVTAAGATPIFADVDKTLCLCPDSIKEAMTPRTKAVIAVHMCGASAAIDELSSFCRDNRLLLLEDACQAFGATFKGQALGTIGDAGCYSFDFNKMVTCGEGGALLTGSEDIYRKADMYHDHGHDHSNEDRGAEGHPFAGYNYRVSELHAAIGCAQIAKADRFLKIQRENKRVFKEALAGVPGVEFRSLPDPDGDAATFVSFFMPTEDQARNAAKALRGAGIDGVFHWYDNNWHYIRNWDHIKNRRFVNPISSDILKNMPDYSKAQFKSDEIVSRCVSITVKMGWSKDEVTSRAEKITSAVRSVL